MPYCGTFGCACCTCQECFNSRCTCELRKRAKELLDKIPEGTDDDWISRVIDLLEDARDESW